MNPTLLALLAWVGVVNGAEVYTPKQDTAAADLGAAGILTQCSARIGSCTVELGSEGQAFVGIDGGSPKVYAQLRTGVVLCPGPQVVVPRLAVKAARMDDDVVRFDFDTCHLMACTANPNLCKPANLGQPNNFDLADVKPCRKRPVGAAPNTCLRLAADGGTYDWGDGNVMPVAEAVGACVPAACYVHDWRDDP